MWVGGRRVATAHARTVIPLMVVDPPSALTARCESLMSSKKTKAKASLCCTRRLMSTLSMRPKPRILSSIMRSVTWCDGVGGEGEGDGEGDGGNRGVNLL